MANFYYLGRNSFPTILIAVVASSVISICCLFSAGVVFNWNSEVEDEKARLMEVSVEIRQKLDGTMLEMAISGVKKYKETRGKLNIKKTFTFDLRENARYVLPQRNSILRAIHRDMSDEDLDKLVASFHVIGLHEKISNENNITKLLLAFISGSDQNEEIMNLLERYPRFVPPEVALLLSPEKFIFKEGEAENPTVKNVLKFDLGKGAESILEDARGVNAGMRVDIDESTDVVEKKAKENTVEYKKKEDIYASYKKELFQKKDKQEKDLWGFLTKQGESWGAYYEQTHEFLEDQRRRGVEMKDLKDQIEYLESLLEERLVRGKDWIPPLDLVDGSVLLAKPELGVVIVDIGRRDGLKLGQRFDVFRVKGGLTHDKKGRIEVTDLKDLFSICRILEADGFNPIVPGDMVANGELDSPFDRKIRSTYTLRGYFTSHPSKNLIHSMIKNAGGKLVDRIDKRLNYLILGFDTDKKDVELCRKIGIRVIRPIDLSGHFGMSHEDVTKLDSKFWKKSSSGTTTQP